MLKFCNFSVFSKFLQFLQSRKNYEISWNKNGKPLLVTELSFFIVTQYIFLPTRLAQKPRESARKMGNSVNVVLSLEKCRDI